MPCSLYIRKEDTIHLSESLNEDAVHSLVEAALSNILPELCKEWNVAVKDTREYFRQELSKRQDKICQDLASQEDSLKHTLRYEVVGDVMKIFP